MLKLIDWQSNPEVIAFCMIWLKEQQVPLVFADWLLDHDFEQQAEIVKWASMTDRIARFSDHCKVRPFLRDTGYYKWTSYSYPKFVSDLVYKQWSALTYYTRKEEQDKEYISGIIACIDLLDNGGLP